MTTPPDAPVMLKGCPFCGDPMAINISGMIEHVEQTEGCPIRQNAWPAETWLVAWNQRSPAQRERQGAVEALERFERHATYPVSKSIDAKGYGWMPDPTLDFALTELRSAIAALTEREA